MSYVKMCVKTKEFGPGGVELWGTPPPRSTNGQVIMWKLGHDLALKISFHRAVRVWSQISRL